MAIITYKPGEFRSWQTGKTGLIESLAKAQPGDIIEAHTLFQAEVLTKTIIGICQTAGYLKGISVKIKGQDDLFYDASKPAPPKEGNYDS